MDEIIIILPNIKKKNLLAVSIIWGPLAIIIWGHWVRSADTTHRRACALPKHSRSFG